MKFRKKPVEIEAYQTEVELNIETLEGTMHANVGDWIITGLRGEQYPCKPDIFEMSYEPVIEGNKDLEEYLAKPFFEQVKELEELVEEANRRE